MESIFGINWLFYAFLTSLPLIYWYLNRGFDYWSKRGIDGPKPLPIFGNSLRVLSNNKPAQAIAVYQKYGKIYGTYDFTKPVLNVAEPELIKQILVKDFYNFTDRQKTPPRHPISDRGLVVVTGDDWKRIRSIVSPTFTSGKMKKMYPQIKQCLKDFLDSLEVYAKADKDMDMKVMYGNLTMDVIATCAFGTKTNSHKDPNNPFMVNAKKAFGSNYLQIIMFMILPNFVTRLLKFSQIGSNDIREFFFGIIRKIIKERKNSDKKYNDFIEMLLNVEKNNKDIIRDVNDINEAHHVNEGAEELEAEKKLFANTQKYMTENEIIASAQTFLLAGYETTATALCQCTRELALNPDKQQKLYEEVMSSVDSEGEIDYDLLAKLPYLDAVLSETLRMHSPAMGTARISNSDHKLGDTGITLFKGQRVGIPIYAIHHDEEYYPNPDQFIPERFLPENRHKLIPYTYLPFGGGPRNCVGMRLALMEAKMSLAQVVKQFKINKSPNTDIPIRWARSPILLSPERIIVRMEKR